MPRWLQPVAADPLERVVEADVRAELGSHIELCAEELVLDGVDPEAALAEARARFGDFDRISRRCRNTKLGARRMAKLIPYVIIAILVIAMFGLFTQANRQRLEAERARAVAMDEMSQARALLEERARQEPVDHVRAGLGDTIQLIDRDRTGWGHSARVAPDGMALFPNLGWVEVHGKTREQLESHFNEAYATYHADLIIDVDIQSPQE